MSSHFPSICSLYLRLHISFSYPFSLHFSPSIRRSSNPSPESVVSSHSPSPSPISAIEILSLSLPFVALALIWLRLRAGSVRSRVKIGIEGARFLRNGGVALEDFILLVLFIYLFVGSGFMEGVCASFQNPRHWISFVVLAADSFVCHEFWTLWSSEGSRVGREEERWHSFGEFRRAFLEFLGLRIGPCILWILRASPWVYRPLPHSLMESMSSIAL